MEIDRLVPMQWPCGPLEIARGCRGNLTSGERECLEHWSRPEALGLLDGTPVSGLVVPWADGEPGDDEHQRAIAPLIAAARGLGLSVVGQVADEIDLRRAAATARPAGLEALATESGDLADGFPVLRFRERGFDDRSPASFLGVTGIPWPGLKASGGDAFDAVTGPTGPPWIDSNAWYVRLARELSAPGTLWLSFDPPATGGPVPAGAYVQAIADAEIYGARWVVSLDAELRLGLSRGETRAMEEWTQIGRALAFFRKHRAWADDRPAARLGVVSDFAGSNEFLSFEVVNLLARQSSTYSILEKSRAIGAPFDQLKAVVYVDEAPPDQDLRRRLYAFAEAGGTLITPPGWKEPGTREPGAPFSRFHVSRWGRGRLAVAREELTDPQLLAEDAQLLTSHRHDLVRLFNPGTARFHYSTSEDGRSGVLHVFRFARRYFDRQVTAWFRTPWASARTWRTDADGAQAAGRTPSDPGVEFHLPPVSVYCAVELSTSGRSSARAL